MFVQSIWVQDFLSFNESPALRLTKGLTVVTGPNGAGKSNLARSLDVARAVLAPNDHPESERLELYREAGFEGAAEFTVKLDMFLDQPWELTPCPAVRAVCLPDVTPGPASGVGRLVC